jgi:hypothetical protein
MTRLFRASPFKRDCTRIQFEDEAVNLFAECRKESAGRKVSGGLDITGKRLYCSGASICIYVHI